jgi:DNA-binding transcriptional MerR regulator
MQKMKVSVQEMTKILNNLESDLSRGMLIYNFLGKADFPLDEIKKIIPALEEGDCHQQAIAIARYYKLLPYAKESYKKMARKLEADNKIIDAVRIAYEIGNKAHAKRILKRGLEKEEKLCRYEEAWHWLKELRDDIINDLGFAKKKQTYLTIINMQRGKTTIKK